MWARRHFSSHCCAAAAAMPLLHAAAAAAGLARQARLLPPSVQVVWGNPTDASSIPAGPFDVVYDNNGEA